MCLKRESQHERKHVINVAPVVEEPHLPSSSAVSPAPPGCAAVLAPVSSSRPPSELAGRPPPSEKQHFIPRKAARKSISYWSAELTTVRKTCLEVSDQSHVTTDLSVQLIMHVLPPLLLLPSLLILPAPPLFLLSRSLLLSLSCSSLLPLSDLLQPPLLLLSPQPATTSIKWTLKVLVVSHHQSAFDVLYPEVKEY